MTISFKEISNQTLTSIRQTLDKAKLAETYLRSVEKKHYSPNLLVILGFIIYIIVLFLATSWTIQYYLLISGIVLSYLLFRDLQTYFVSKKLGNDSVFFDSTSFFYISEKEVQVFPLADFRYTDVISSLNSHYYLVRFHFKNGLALSSRLSKEESIVNKFQFFWIHIAKGIFKQRQLIIFTLKMIISYQTEYLKGECLYYSR